MSAIPVIVAVRVCPTTEDPLIRGDPVAGELARSARVAGAGEISTAKLVSDSWLPLSSLKVTLTFRALPSSLAVTV